MSTDLDKARIGFHRRIERERRDDHAALFELAVHHFVDPLMQRIVKMLRPQRGRNALNRGVVDKDCAEQRLLDFDIVGDVTVGFLFHMPVRSEIRSAAAGTAT